MPDFDTILVGGGLQNALIALAMRRKQPAARIALIDRSERLGGNHTWCCHWDDLSPEMRTVIEPLVVHRWSGYRVRFPDNERVVDREYSAVTSERLHDVVSMALGRAPGCEIMLGQSVRTTADTWVELEDGHRLDAALVVDARGPSVPAPGSPAGFQKFLGIELELEHAHAFDLPIVMDAAVDQTDGYRFMYVLPLSPQRVLIEDTYFNESPLLDRERIRSEVQRYADHHGLAIASVVREETGVLPMPWGGSLPALGGGPLRAGYRGGWFHPATGYSFPVAARLAECVAQAASSDERSERLTALIRSHTSQARYCHLLNHFLFRWYPPAERWHIYDRFYRLPKSTIARFYALRMNKTDRVRLLAGRPPRGLSVRHRLQAGAVT